VGTLVLRFQVYPKEQVVVYEYTTGYKSPTCRELTNEDLGKGLRVIVLNQLRSYFGMQKP